MLNLGLMPPYEEPQPELAEMKPVIDWITGALKAHYEAEESTGGQTVLRRLNRNEYRNTIRDLLHLDMTIFDPTDAFPQDDEEHGFDNIGKTLVMSDFLVEKYLDAADQNRATRRIARLVTKSKNVRIYLSHHARWRWIFGTREPPLETGIRRAIPPPR